MSVTLTIELDSLAQASVITDALQREIEGLTNSLSYYTKQADEPFSQKGLAVDEREEARTRHEARRRQAKANVASAAAKLELAQSVWQQVGPSDG